MSTKYKVVVIAYRELKEEDEQKIYNSSIRTLDDLDDLKEVYINCSGKGFNQNDRVCIYLDWFRDKAKEKIEEGYNVGILEMPIKSGNVELEVYKQLDIDYGEDLLVLESVDV